MNDCWQQEGQHNLWMADKPTLLPNPTAQTVLSSRPLKLLQLPRVILPELLLRNWVSQQALQRERAHWGSSIGIEIILILTLLFFLHSLIPIQEHLTNIYYKGQKDVKVNKKGLLHRKRDWNPEVKCLREISKIHLLRIITKCWSSATQLHYSATQTFVSMRKLSMNKEHNCHNLSKYL